MTTHQKILVLVGPTASGKTEASICIAKHLNGEIISADSRQVYRYLDIGTAKPTPAQRQQVTHHFVDELLPDEDFSAGDFGLRGRQVIERIFERGKAPIVVGGSGLYIQALIDGIFKGPSADKALRARLEREVEEGRVSALIQELKRVDPDSATTADPTKPRRIIRALEVYHSTGKAISQYHRESTTPIPYACQFFGLEWDRQDLYERINRRCDNMVEAGLLGEVENLERRGYDSSLNALNTVGYAEAFTYRSGQISFDEMNRLFKQNSRRYAKRQLTWFRSDTRIKWIRMDETRKLTEVAQEIIEHFVAS